ncbi:MAG: xanthine dehydrogenase family protein molybdopterin-binding subunit [Dehalococcoidia bacterium]|nr:xanthine dehydrogenase family protein molybdopterin-binding subunit [Dehalococcoidia bacterium]
MPEYSILGKPTPRIDEGAPKAKGEAKFSVDVMLPGMLWGGILQSPHAHARIVKIDTSRAASLPGVKAVMTGRDLPERIKLPLMGPPLPGDQYAMARDMVRYVGEPLAAVAAVDEDTAEEALRLIDVEYEVLPAIFDAEEAMKPGAVQLHDHSPQNTPATSFDEYGDVEKGFAESDYVREDTFKFQRIAYNHPEPQNAVASFNPMTDELTMWASAQSATGLRKSLGHLLDMPWTKIRVIGPFVGGGFGGRSFVSAIYVAAAFLSIKLGRPVKIVNSREGEFCLDWHARHDTVVKLKTGVKKDGTLVARDAVVIYDAGAYKVTMKGPQPQAYSSCMHVPYLVQNLRLRGIAVYTNKQPVGPFRGYGQYPTLWSCDFQMDLIARDLGLDRLEIRMKNTVKPDTVTPLGFHIGTCGVNDCLQGVGNAIEWEKTGSAPSRTGKGFSTSWFASPTWGGSPDNPLGAKVRVNIDGTADLMLVGTDSGSGQYSTLCMMIAETLGVPLENVKRLTGDTAQFPNDEAGLFTVTVAAYGEPVKLAAEKARQMILEAVADKLEANVQDLTSKDGKVFVKGSPEKGMPFAEAARIATEAKGTVEGRGDVVQWGYRHFGKKVMEERYIKYSFPGTAPGMGFGAAGAEVEVDKETGLVEVRRLAHAYDVGFAVNPLGVITQLQGSAVQSMGGILTEEIIRDHTGQIMNPSYTHYGFTTALDIPEIIPIIIEEHDSKEGERGAGAYGAKELGMGALCASGGAVASAVYDAIGAMLHELPATPERVLEAMERRG